MKRRRIFIRADGHQQMGLGHVVRSLALAEMLKEEYDIVFATRHPLPSLADQIRQPGIALCALATPSSDLAEAQWICQHHVREDDIVVLDGYHFTTEYQSTIKRKAGHLVAIDDIHAIPYVADIVINHALGIAPSDYVIAPDTKLLLGTEYSLLRKEFRTATKRKLAQRPTEGSLLLCLGGADPKNDTLRLLQQLEGMGVKKHIQLVLGAAYAYRNVLNKFLQGTSCEISVHQDLSASQLAALFQRCPVAILPPSTIAYEYLSMGGLLFLEVIADNQKRMFESFIAAGLAQPFQSFPTSLAVPTITWQNLLARQAQYFDGQQQARFKHIFAQLAVAVHP